MAQAIANTESEKEMASQDVVLMVELMVAPGKSVNIPIRKDDKPEQIASNFAKTYSLNKTAQESLCKILHANIVKQEPESS